MEEKKITVIGSCVCRDLFENAGDDFSFHTDFRFFSPISMLAEPVDFLKAENQHFLKDVKVVNGNWYRKNILNDINKTSFTALEERHGEYLVLDFAESRISIAELSWPERNKKLLLSYSVSFREHYNASFKKNIFKDAKLVLHNPLEYTDEQWRQTIQDFYKKITKIFDEEKIILIKNMPAEHYVDANGYLHPYSSKDHFESILLCKLLISKLNNYFLEVCKGCKVIEIPPHAIGMQMHKWGNHPFHFTNIYYDYLLKCVRSITSGHPNNLESVYEEYSNAFKDEYDSCVIKTATRMKAVQNNYGIEELLKEYEDYNHLGKKQKALILFALDKKHFFRNFNKMRKE